MCNGSKRDDFLVTDELATPRDSKQVDLILPDDDAFLQEGVTR
ncbi:10209_t:CDS:2 [Paraglomus occultum]|uniref:10209_t:CDS:1 n=1 Tax=Paraglomus occultum TaxID=144539 RepID=A0A9N9BLI3_9GLOM|nr:10209_t:CDS:2 [Paraglomus occultum]